METAHAASRSPRTSHLTCGVGLRPALRTPARRQAGGQHHTALLLPFLLLLLVSCATPRAPETPLASFAHPLTGEANDYDPLIKAIGFASVVLLGESSHGTHEFYVERARITQRLIREKAFTAVALEANWGDAERVHRYVMGAEDVDPLGDFDDFPRWMWRNREFAGFIEWLREHNRIAEHKVGIYGLDLQGDDDSEPVRVLKNRERFRRARNHVSSWNIRDRHMAATVDLLQRDLIRRTGTGKIVVWVHNSHAGDARATNRTRYSELSLGQLVREHWPPEATFSVGFMTDRGTVMAAQDWDSPPKVQKLSPSVRGSHGAILREVGLPRFLLLLGELEHADLRRARLQRGIGVVYRPMVEYASNYYPAKLAGQFDAVIHIDETTALTPLD